MLLLEHAVEKSFKDVCMPVSLSTCMEREHSFLI